MTRAEKTEADLQATLAALSSWHSMAELAKALGITEQSAHNRMAALRKRGHSFAEQVVRTSFLGPKTKRFRIALDSRHDEAQSRDSIEEE